MASEYVQEKHDGEKSSFVETPTINTLHDSTFSASPSKNTALHSPTSQSQSLPTFEFICLILQIAISSAGMLFGLIPIHNYEVFGESKGKAREITNGCLGSTIICVPDALRNPSPEMFIFGSIIFGLAAISYHHLHVKDQHQSQILSVGIKIGLVASVISSLVTRNIFEFKTYMPLAILVSLTLSSATHRALELNSE